MDQPDKRDLKRLPSRSLSQVLRMEARVDTEVSQVETKCGKTGFDDNDSHSNTLSERDDDDCSFDAEAWPERGALTLATRRLPIIKVTRERRGLNGSQQRCEHNLGQGQAARKNLDSPESDSSLVIEADRRIDDLIASVEDDLTPRLTRILSIQDTPDGKAEKYVTDRKSCLGDQSENTIDDIKAARLLMELNSGSSVSDTFPRVLSPRKSVDDEKASFWPPRSPAVNENSDEEGSSINHQVEKGHFASTESDSIRDSINDSIEQKPKESLHSSSSPESVSNSPDRRALAEKKALFNGWSIRFRVSSPRSPVGLLYDQQLLQHFGSGIQLEQPGRISVAFQNLVDQGLQEKCLRVNCRMATDDELLLCHTQEHLDFVKGGSRWASEKSSSQKSCASPSSSEDVSSSGDSTLTRSRQKKKHPQPTYSVYEKDPDIFFNPSTESCARLAAGSVISAVDSVLSGRTSRAFALVRPPGHHALSNKPMGFCFYNNCALGAAYALEKYDHVNRVVILDIDVHHGNGIQEIFESDPRVLYVSMHRFGKGFFPYTGGISEVGKGPGRGYNVNIPWVQKGVGTLDYLVAFQFLVLPIIQEFSPDLMVIAAGFDAAEGDPLGEMKVHPRGFADIIQMLLDNVENIPLVLALEGGYDENIVGTCVVDMLSVLLGQRLTPWLESQHSMTQKIRARCRSLCLKGGTEDLIRRVLQVQSSFWPSLAKSKDKLQRYLASVLV